MYIFSIFSKACSIEFFEYFSPRILRNVFTNTIKIANYLSELELYLFVDTILEDCYDFVRRIRIRINFYFQCSKEELEIFQLFFGHYHKFLPNIYYI